MWESINICYATEIFCSVISLLKILSYRMKALVQNTNTNREHRPSLEDVDSIFCLLMDENF